MDISCCWPLSGASLNMTQNNFIFFLNFLLLYFFSWWIVTTIFPTEIWVSYDITRFCWLLLLIILEISSLLSSPLTVLWFGPPNTGGASCLGYFPLLVFFQSIFCPVNYQLNILKWLPMAYQVQLTALGQQTKVLHILVTVFLSSLTFRLLLFSHILCTVAAVGPPYLYSCCCFAQNGFYRAI